MRFDEMTRLGDEDLRKALSKASEDLLRLRVRQATRQLENPMEIPRTRREIARIKTLLRQRELTRG